MYLAVNNHNASAYN